jgi:hypothetical protein
LAAPAQAETRTPGAGGGGGGPFQASCGSGWMLRGFALRTGSWIDAATPICILTGATGIDSHVDEKLLAQTFGGGGGGPRRIACDRNAAVRGLQVEHGMATDKTRVVTGVELICGKPDGSGGPLSQPNLVAYSPAKPKSIDVRLSCPPGQVATGVFGRSGQWLDQIGLVCDRSPLN